MIKMYDTLINFAIVTTITATVILIIKGVLKSKISSRLHYYIWSFLILRLLMIPFVSENNKIYKVNNNIVPININVNTEPIAIKMNNTRKSVVIKKNFEVNSQKIICIIWAFGAGCTFLYFNLINGVFYFNIKKINDCNDDDILMKLEEYKKKIGIDKKIKVKIYDGLSMIVGIIHPIILINNKYTNEEVKYIVAHELYHLKNRDTLINYIALFVLSINWYNPIVWISYFKFRIDTEILCDTRVVELIKEKKNYAKLLVKSVSKSLYSIENLSLCMQNGKKEVKRRVEFMAKTKKETKKYILFIMSIIVVCFCGTFALPKVKASGNDKTAIEQITNSITYNTDKKVMSFSVPKEIPKGYKLFLHISGHIQTKDGPVVYHAFEDETYNYQWINGKEYLYEFKDEPMIETTFDFGLLNEKTNEIEDETILTLNKDGSLQ